METVKIGKIVNTHGLKGELKIIPSTHFIEERFGKGASILIRKDSVHVHVKVERIAGRPRHGLCRAGRIARHQ